MSAFIFTSLCSVCGVSVVVAAILGHDISVLAYSVAF